MHILSSIVKAITVTLASGALAFASLLGYPPTPIPTPTLTPTAVANDIQLAPEPNLGQAITKVVALFETSLRSPVTSTATSMTLISGVDKQGVALSGSYGFTINEGFSDEEFVICTASGVNLTGCLRGISVTDGKTEVAALKKPHRRGDTVVVTNHPSLAILSRLANGDEGYPNILRYEGHPDFSGAASTSFVDIAYVASLSFAGTVDATTSIKGISEAATTAEINSGTSLGGTGALLFVNPAFLAVSSYSSQLLTENQEAALEKGGAYGSLSLTNPVLTAYSASSSAVFLPVTQVYTATTSWSKPAGLKYIYVCVVGGGGGGGNANNSNPDTSGSGGGGGGYACETLSNSELSAVSSVAVNIGSGGTSGNSGGTTSFGSFLSATGGTGGSQGGLGSAGGLGSGGDINGGGGRGTTAAFIGQEHQGFGGDSHFSGGGSQVYGAGGDGGLKDSAAGQTGGNGVIIVVEHYI